MRAAIYARVSSAAQRDAHTVESQLHVLRAYVKAQGWQLVGEYIDDGRSAKTGMLEHRDAFARLMRDGAAQKFDLLVVLDVNRLTRTGSIEERAEILGPFQRLNIQIATPASGIMDLRSFLGEVYVMLQALVAAEENRKRTSAIMAGKLRAIAEGRKPAGPTPFGWSYSRARGEWSLDAPAATIMREIFVRVAAGESCAAVADDLIARDAKPAPRTGWTRAAVYRIVRKRTAVGEWDADKARGAIVRIPPIVTEDEWQDAARALLAHKRRGLRRTKHVYLLEGLARCGHCGAPIRIRSTTTYMVRGEKRENASAYVCRNRQAGTCPATIVKSAEIDARVWAALCEEIVQPDLMQALADASVERAADEHDWQADATGYRAHLGRLERVESALMARFRRGTVTEGALDVELAAMGRERAAVRGQLATAERAMWAAQSAQSRLEAAGDVVAQLRAALPHASPEQRRALLRELALDGGVVVTDGRARLDIRILRSVGATSCGDGVSSIALVKSPDYRKQREAITHAYLRIRLVA